MLLNNVDQRIGKMKIGTNMKLYSGDILKE